MTQRVSEHDFLALLEAKSSEDKRILATELLPVWARGVGEWLVVNPWRVLIPVSTGLYVLIRSFMGIGFREFILGLFGGF
jgi:hypothetical protein